MEGERHVLDPAYCCRPWPGVPGPHRSVRLVIGLAWAVAPATSPAVRLAAAATPAGNTAAGAPSPGRTAGFVLDHGRYLPVAPPRGLEDLVSGPLSPFDINDHGQIVGSYLDPAARERGFLLDRGPDSAPARASSRTRTPSI